MKKVLITGAAGEIGSSLRNNLSLIYNLRCLDIVEITDEEDFILADILDFEAVFTSMKGVNYVIHLAGKSDPEPTWNDVCSHGITGTYHVFEAARRSGIKKVVFASSIHVLSFQKEFLKKNITSINSDYPMSLYAVGKTTDELLARFFSETYGMSIMCIRIGSFYVDPPHPQTPQDEIMKDWCSPDDLTNLIKYCLDSEGRGFQVLYCLSDLRLILWGRQKTRQFTADDPQKNAKDPQKPIDDNRKRQDPFKEHVHLIRAAIDPSKEALTSWKRWLEMVDIKKETLDTLSFRLLPLIYDNLADLNVEHTCIPKLKGIYRRSWLENQLSLQKIIPLIKQLSEKGIKLLLLDDLNSIYRLYNGKGVRQIYTLDLLIHPDDVKQVLDFFKEQNIWPKVHFGERFLLVETPLEIWSPFNFPLTISWRATPYLKSKQSATEIWDLAGKADLGDCQVFTLDTETHFLRMCVRSVNSRLDAAFFSTIDVAWMLAKHEKDIEWERVIDLAVKNHQVLPVIECLHQISEVIEMVIVQDLLDQLAKIPVTLIDRLENRWINHSDPFPNRFDRFMRRLLLFRRSPKIPGFLGYFRYFQYTWGGSSLISLPKLIFRHMFR